MPARNFTDSEEAEIGKLYQSGISARAIARAYVLSHHISITSALKRQGIKQRSAPERNRLYGLDPHVFDVIDTEEKAYWWGFIYADGHVNKRTVIVSLKVTDDDQLDKLRSFIKSESPIHYKLGNCGNGNRYAQCHIEFTDRHLAKRLRELGVVSRRPHFNRVLANLPGHLACHWIRGYFDGDGSISEISDRKQPAIKIVGQMELVEWIRLVLHKNTGSPATGCIYKHTTSEIYYVNYSGRKRCLGIADFLYKGATVWMERKRKRFDKWHYRPTAAGTILTPIKVKEIKSLYLTGNYTHESLGRMYGVSKSTIGHAIRGTHNWRDID